MAENTNIAWCDHTFNPWEGCQKVGPGCDHCYAETRNARFSGGTSVNWGPGAPRRRTSAANWRKPIAWNRNAGEFYAQHGRRQRVFCASLADVFDNAVDPTWREDLFALIRATPNLDWLLLTKRIGNVPSMVSLIPGWLPENVWLGATIVNQAEADRDIQKLLETPARVHFLSIEPMLGPINLESVAWPSIAEHRVDALRGGYWNKAGVLACGPAAGLGEPRGGFTNHSDMPGRIDWVIVGGESGPGARPMHPDWARDLRDQCVSAGVPFLFKQWGDFVPGSGDFGAGQYVTAAVARDGRIVPGGFDAAAYPRGATSADGWAMVHRVGKKAADRLLDGAQHDQFPHVRS